MSKLYHWRVHYLAVALDIAFAQPIGIPVAPISAGFMSHLNNMLISHIIQDPPYPLPLHPRPRSLSNIVCIFLLGSRVGGVDLSTNIFNIALLIFRSQESWYTLGHRERSPAGSAASNSKRGDYLSGARHPPTALTPRGSRVGGRPPAPTYNPQPF